MSWVDLVIAVLVILAALRGAREGAVRQIFSLAGLGVGFVLGTMIAPRLSQDVTHASWRPALALFIVLASTLIVSQLGNILGSFAANSLRTLKLGVVDRVGGVVVAGLGTLVACWLIAGLLVSTTWGSIASGIQRSRILAAMDKVMPPLPSIEARFQTLFRNADFPNVFASVVAPTLPPYVNPSRLGPLVRNVPGPTDVLKVLAGGSCATNSEGTAFFVSPHEAVTNAHVVAGHSHVTVNGAPAEVALYDPRNDLAVLRVPTLHEPVLHFLSALPSPGTPIRIVGFPLNATRTESPGFFEGELSGQGRDIYNQDLTTRSFLDLEANVQPGNSGSPVFVGALVAGVVESKSLSQGDTGYAIPFNVVKRDVAKTPASGTVSTQSCLP